MPSFIQIGLLLVNLPWCNQIIGLKVSKVVYNLPQSSLEQINATFVEGDHGIQLEDDER
jgi:hypothetical protein